ncbi:lipid A deacylase LpxR family protein [Photobacterium kagoshimensis]|uniref:lipid A deacylase LpxR family protein n=1 Tax=Photobacterium kagoshimensis TaxID=2910242 RepID=UPI003D137E33
MRIYKKATIGFPIIAMTTLFTSALVVNVHAANTTTPHTFSSISFSMENDGIVQNDQNYTNGIFLNYSSAVTSELANNAPFPIATLANWLPLNNRAWQGWRIKLGQQMWTPSDITIEKPQPNERPYAGLLFLDTGIFQYTANQADKFTLRLGTVGPNALAESAQKFVHSITPSKEPKGWAYQIENELVANANYEGHRLVNRFSSFNDKQWEWSAVGRLDAGNYRSEAAFGSVIRWGNQLSETFGSIGFTPNQITDVGLLSSSHSGYFLYTGLEGRYRFNDITLEGDKPIEVDDVTLQHWQASLIAGVVFYRSNWGISLSMAADTKSFEEDSQEISPYGAFKIFYRY